MSNIREFEPVDFYNIDDLLTEEQKLTSEQRIAAMNASGIWPGPVVTELEPVGPFWEAEPEHQDYLMRVPNGYTCHFPRADWVLPNSA